MSCFFLFVTKCASLHAYHVPYFFHFRPVGAANGSLPQVRKGKEKETDQLPGLEANQSENFEAGRASREEIYEPGAANMLSRILGGENGDGGPSEFSADSPVSNHFHHLFSVLHACWSFQLGPLKPSFSFPTRTYSYLTLIQF